VTAPTRVTHPLHPLYGQQLDLAVRRPHFGKDRVFYRDPHGHLASLPAWWTSEVPEDPFVVTSAGRSWFRVDDLLALAALVERLRS
jgi:hypothetical protein